MPQGDLARAISSAIKNAIRAVAKRGLFGIALAIATAVAIVAAVAGVMKMYSLSPSGGEVSLSAETQTQEERALPAAAVDKTDPKWLKRYCFSEAVKLPVPPFPTTGKEGPDPVSPGLELNRILPEDKNQSSCRMYYGFDSDQAYAFYFGEKKFWDIKDAYQFHDNVESYYADEMTKMGWRNITYEYEELIAPPSLHQSFFFRRVNSELGTTEYVDITLAVGVYIDLTVVEN